MEKSTLSGLCDHANQTFILASELANYFKRESEAISAFGYRGENFSSHWEAFSRFSESLLQLKREMQKPPKGFGPVAKGLKDLAVVAKAVRDEMQSSDGMAFRTYLNFQFELSTVSLEGVRVARDLVKAQQLDDPFAFADQPAADKETVRPEAGLVATQGEAAEPPAVAPIPKVGNCLGSIDSDQTGRGESSDCKTILVDKWDCPRGAIHVPDRLIKPLKAYLDGDDSFSLSSGEDPYKLATELGGIIREGKEKGFLPYPDRWPSGEGKKGQKIPFLRFNKVEGKNKRNTRRHKKA